MKLTLRLVSTFAGLAILTVAVACGGAGDAAGDGNAEELDLPKGIPNPLDESIGESIGETLEIETDSPASSGMMIPRATNAEQLIFFSQIVLVGTIASIEQEILFGGYDENGQPESYEDEEGTPYTDYMVEVERLLKSDGNVVEGGTFTMRLFGHANPTGTQILSIQPVLPNVGDSLLLALGKNPDHTYGSGPDGLIGLDSGKPVFIDGQVLTEMASSDFLEAIVVAVAETAITDVDVDSGREKFDPETGLIEPEPSGE
jgi:hypothetical protein